MGQITKVAHFRHPKLVKNAVFGFFKMDFDVKSILWTLDSSVNSNILFSIHLHAITMCYTIHKIHQICKIDFT